MKISFCTIASAVAFLVSLIPSQAAALTWNNGASTGIWNTTDANWSGSIWNNSTPDSAFFKTVGGTVTLASGISASGVTVGDTSSNFTSLTLTGGTLNDSGTLVVQGYSSNAGSTDGGLVAVNPTVTINSAVTVTEDTLVGRANLKITGGTYTTNRITGNSDWANVSINGGTVTATNGIDGTYGTNGSNGPTATFSLTLNGGTLYTPSIKVADREVGSNNNSWLTFNGTTVKATASTATFITLYGGNQNAYVSNGGGILDTNGNDITIGVNLKNTSGQNGTLTKQGAGTLTLSGNNTYNGTTTINGGVLNLAQQNAAQNTLVSLVSGSLVFDSSVSGTAFTVGGLSGTVGNNIALQNNAGTPAAITLTVGANNANTTFAGVISASGNLTKSGAGTLTLQGTNTYSGVTTFSNGIVNATSLTDFGVACSLGNRTSDSNGNVGLLFRGGTLQFTGSIAQSTNRGIRISTTGGGGTIDASGSDPSATLSFTATASADFFENPGNRTLTLTGSNSGNNTFAMAIGQAVGTTSVVKNGSGTWVLTGNNTYSGGTMLSAGTLSVNRSESLGASSGNLTFAGNSTLAITADITSSRNYTINSNVIATIDTATSTTLSNSGVISGTGSLTKTGTGNLTLTGVNTYSGNTTVSNGNLTVSGNGRLANTGNVIITTGGSLLVASSNAINTSANVTMNGGNLTMAIATAGGNQTLGALTLSANSTLDFSSSSANTLIFSGINSPGSNVFNIINWNLNSDHLYFTNNASLSATNFTVNGGAASLSSFQTGLGYEIIAVPEPGTILVGALLLGGLVFAERRRLGHLLRMRRTQS